MVSTAVLGDGAVVLWRQALPRCLANAAHTIQSRPDSGLGFQVKPLKRLKLISLCLDADVVSTAVLGDGAVVFWRQADPTP